MSSKIDWLEVGKDPIKLGKILWPDVNFYNKQREIIYSVWENDETVVYAGNELGKDFVSGFIALSFFLTRHPVRIVTTSADHSQLEAVLWGEIRRFIQTSKVPLRIEDGGPLLVNHLQIRKLDPPTGELCGISYIVGRVAAKGEGLQGHHVTPDSSRYVDDSIPRTLFIGDEASGLDHDIKKVVDTWAKRQLIIGNPWECENFFKYAVIGTPDGKSPGGSIPREKGGGYYRKNIQIKATDSPNVRWGIAEERLGKPPSFRTLLPGVKSYANYLKHRKMWDEIQQAVCLDARFYEGKELKLYLHLLKAAIARAAEIREEKRYATSLGIDTGEGVSNTSLVAVDDLGIVEMISELTPDTDVIPQMVIDFGTRLNIPPRKWFFDRGGGGKQHADRLRKMGYPVRTVAFGESVKGELTVVQRRLLEREHLQESSYVYKNRRMEMYHRLALAMEDGFAIPGKYGELIRQMRVIPKLYDKEGRLYMLPKNKPNKDSKEKTLSEILGRSPDELDALVLAVWGKDVAGKPKVGALK